MARRTRFRCPRQPFEKHERFVGRKFKRHRIATSTGHRFTAPVGTRGTRVRVWLDRSPYCVVPQSPTIHRPVPHQLSSWRPRRRRRLRCRPHRRWSPRSRARRTTLARRTLPVVAAIPVPVVDSAPSRVPGITGTPVIAGRRGRLDPRGVDAADQSESGQRQPASPQRPRTPANPRLFLFCNRHLPRISLDPHPSNW
jgi:hypothetical protein